MNAVIEPRIDFLPMRDEDVDEVTVAEQRSYAFPWSRGNFVDSLKAGHGMWVCREGGALIGHVVMMMAIDEAHLLNITIVPERQRRGLGGELLRHAMAVVRGHGATRMLLEVRPSNVPARALYRRCGFGEIGRRKAYYPGHAGREDAIVMAIDL